MIRVLLLSDTHSWLDPGLDEFFGQADEIWHAGDIGSMEVLAGLRNKAKKVRAVYGNIDSAEIRRETEEALYWQSEGVSVFMIHIGGYPPKYNRKTRDLLDRHKPDLFICGHSHILKIIPDEKRDLLHINPGAAGYIGFHKMRTAVLFDISNGKIEDLNVVELGLRGQTPLDD